MVPSAFVMIDAMPLNANIKVDYRALPAPEQVRPEGLENDYVAPQNETERIIAEIWSEVLGIKQIGVRDNLFDLGGHSLSVTKIVARTREAFNVEFPLRSLFEAPTVADMALALNQFISQQGVDATAAFR